MWKIFLFWKRGMNDVNDRITYAVMGGGFLLLGIFLIFVAVMANSAPVPFTYIAFAIAIMCLCISYLVPEFFHKDERMQLIKQKGMFYSYFAFLFYSIVLQTLLQFEIINISALAVINILTGLMISTVFISFVILARVY